MGVGPALVKNQLDRFRAEVLSVISDNAVNLEPVHCIDPKRRERITSVRKQIAF